MASEPPPTEPPPASTPGHSSPPGQSPLVTSAPRDEQSAETFWTAVTPNGEYGFEYDTPASIVKDVDLIVLGRIAGVYTGDIHTTEKTWPSIWARFEIDDVLKGNPVSRTPGFVDVMLTSSPAWSFASSNVPDEQVVVFLMNEEANRARVGEAPTEPELEHYEYWRPDEQAVVRNIGGKVGVIDAERMRIDYGSDVFPMTVLGDDFDATVSAIKKVVAAQ